MNEMTGDELWTTGEYLLKLLAILIMDSKQLTQDMIDQLTSEMQNAHL